MYEREREFALCAYGHIASIILLLSGVRILSVGLELHRLLLLLVFFFCFFFLCWLFITPTYFGNEKLMNLPSI